MAEWIGFAATVAGIVVKGPDIIRNIRSILGSKTALANTREQQSEFSKYLKAVKRRTRRLHARNPARVPRSLLNEVNNLTGYCDRIVAEVFRYHERYCNEFRVRFVHWVSISAGKNQSTIHNRRLQECEDWLSIAAATIYLESHVERLHSADPLISRNCIDRSEGLRRALQEASRYEKGFPRRMRHMRQHVDLEVLRKTATTIAHDRAFTVLVSSEVSDSTCCPTPSPLPRAGGRTVNSAYSTAGRYARHVDHPPADYVEDVRGRRWGQVSPKHLVDNRPSQPAIQPQWREEGLSRYTHYAQNSSTRPISSSQRNESTVRYTHYSQNTSTSLRAPLVPGSCQTYTPAGTKAGAPRDTSTSRIRSNGGDSGYCSVQPTPLSDHAQPYRPDITQQTRQDSRRQGQTSSRDSSIGSEPLDNPRGRRPFVQGNYTPNPASRDTSVPIYPITVQRPEPLPASHIPQAHTRHREERSDSRRHRNISGSSSTSRGNRVTSRDSGYAERVSEPANKHYPPNASSNRKTSGRSGRSRSRSADLTRRSTSSSRGSATYVSYSR